jgi:hypothetical protein
MALPDRFCRLHSLHLIAQVLCLTVMVGLGEGTVADDACPRTPLERIETGMHSARIRRIDVDAERSSRPECRCSKHVWGRELSFFCS